MAKARITTDEHGYVTLAYDGETMDGEYTRIERVFSCRDQGGYVREEVRPGEWQQVCDRLQPTGSTLMCSSRDRLADLIRREWQARRRYEQRDGTSL